MYIAKETRYDNMKYNYCGASGLKLPAVSLGLWHNFGSNGNFDTMMDMCETAFDNGITHFDLANNYGPYDGAAEENFGKILDKSLRPYRDEMIISTKAGYTMWPGPYGDWGSSVPAVACARKLFADALLYDMVIVIEEDALCVNVKMHFRDFFKLIGSCDLAVHDAVAVIFSRVFSKGFFIGT